MATKDRSLSVDAMNRDKCVPILLLSMHARICHTICIRGQARHLYKYYYVCDKKVHLCNFESRQFQFNLSHSPEKHKIHFSISPCVCSHTRLDLFLIIWKLSLAVAPLWFTREHSSKYMIMSKWNEIFVWMFNELSWLRSLLKPLHIYIAF